MKDYPIGLKVPVYVKVLTQKRKCTTDEASKLRSFLQGLSLWKAEVDNSDLVED